MSAGQITILLQNDNPKSKADLDEIYHLLYDDIKKIANVQLANVHGTNTISATVLANECYIKLIQAENLNHQNRKHFLNYLAKAMRRFLIDQIRNNHREKRKGIMQYDQMSQVLGAENINFNLIEIDRLLDQLSIVDSHLGDLCQQKIIFNFTYKELAEIFNLSERQIIRQWNQAKTLLLTMLGEHNES